MAYSYALERIYLAHEYNRQNPSRLRVMGTLLSAAFDGPPSNRDMLGMLRQLSNAPVGDREQGHRTLH